MKPSECVCYDCPIHTAICQGDESEDYDCACESGPFFDEEACGQCKW